MYSDGRYDAYALFKISVGGGEWSSSLLGSSKPYRIVKQKRNATWKAIKVAVIACLICFSLLFTACICIPKIRAAIFEVVVEWYESYIAV